MKGLRQEEPAWAVGVGLRPRSCLARRMAELKREVQGGLVIIVQTEEDTYLLHVLHHC